jgi:hypothetical protein
VGNGFCVSVLMVYAKLYSNTRYVSLNSRGDFRGTPSPFAATLNRGGQFSVPFMITRTYNVDIGQCARKPRRCPPPWLGASGFGGCRTLRRVVRRGEPICEDERVRVCRPERETSVVLAYRYCVALRERDHRRPQRVLFRLASERMAEETRARTQRRWNWESSTGIPRSCECEWESRQARAEGGARGGSDSSGGFCRMRIRSSTAIASLCSHARATHALYSSLRIVLLVGSPAREKGLV